MKIRKVLPVILLLLTCPVVGSAGESSLSAEDIAEIKRVHIKYEEAGDSVDADQHSVLIAITIPGSI